MKFVPIHRESKEEKENVKQVKPTPQRFEGRQNKTPRPLTYTDMRK